MTIPRSLLIAIAEAVERAGGDMSDVRDLVAVWRRLYADRHGHTSRLAYEGANPRCSCADGGEPDGEDRCERCHGHRPRPNAERAS
jgi:hypothetical protein